MPEKNYSSINQNLKTLLEHSLPEKEFLFPIMHLHKDKYIGKCFQMAGL